MAAVQCRLAATRRDGIGMEVLPEGIRAVDTACGRFGVTVRWERFHWGSEECLCPGWMMPDIALERRWEFDAVFLGALGWLGVPDHVSLYGLLIPIRRAHDLYTNDRPVRLRWAFPYASGRTHFGRRRIRGRLGRGESHQPDLWRGDHARSPGTSRRPDPASVVERAIDTLLAEGAPRTPDLLQERASTEEVGRALEEVVTEAASSE